MKKEKICKKCKRLKKILAKELCTSCYKNSKSVSICGLGDGRAFNVYVNGVKEEITPLIPKLKDDVLKDCIKNPRKYLK